MTAPMDPKRLAEIRTRVDAATPGPWRGDTGQHPPYPQVIRAPVPVNAMTDVVATVTRFQGDQAFIAHTRTDIPDLLAEVERLRGPPHRSSIQRLARHLAAAALERYFGPRSMYGARSDAVELVAEFTSSDAVAMVKDNVVKKAVLEELDRLIAELADRPTPT